LMRNSTLANKHSVVWLVKVYESFYSKTELKHKRRHLLKKLKTKTCSTFDVFYDAITHLYLPGNDYFQKIEMHRELIEYLKDENPSYLDYLPKIDDIIDINDEKRKRVVKEILSGVSSREELFNKNYKERSKIKEKYLLIVDGDYQKKEKAEAYHRLGHLDKNEDYFLKAIKLGSKKANLCIGHHYYELGKYREALSYYHEAKKLKYHSSIKHIAQTKKKLNQDFDIIFEYEDYFNNIDKDISVVHKLAHLYEGKNNIKKAQYYFDLGLKAEDIETIECYGYFLYQNNFNKKLALSFNGYLIKNIETNPNATDRFFSSIIYSIIQLWDNNLEKATKYFDLNYFNYSGIKDSFIIEYLLLLISKNNLYITKELLEKYDLKPRFKPIWYTIMHYLKDDYPDEFLKMGSELEDAVNDMIAHVEEMKIKYK